MTKREDYMARATAAHRRHLERKSQAAAELAKRNALLLQAWNEGATLPELAEAIGISKQAVSYALDQPSGVRGGYQRRADRREGDRRQSERRQVDRGEGGRREGDRRQGDRGEDGGRESDRRAGDRRQE